jgi:hypothetical protein
MAVLSSPSLSSLLLTIWRTRGPGRSGERLRARERERERDGERDGGRGDGRDGGRGDGRDGGRGCDGGLDIPDLAKLRKVSCVLVCGGLGARACAGTGARGRASSESESLLP